MRMAPLAVQNGVRAIVLTKRGLRANRLDVTLPARDAMPQPVTLDLDDTTLEALDRAAERSARSRAEIISQAVQDYLSLQDWQVAKIEAGLPAAERGDFVSEEEIARIAEKYSAPA